MIEAVVLKPKDNIGVALADLKTGVEVKIHGLEARVKITEPIPYQHKFSVRRIDAGEKIIKDGVVIGKATQGIEPGRHVHTHNMTGLRLKAKRQGK
ncbi:MAG: D-galactarate dehydratase [Chloroflexi bacterium]|nr:D-galactarate dehydratase [Chloroflexota bacterium]